MASEHNRIRRKWQDYGGNNAAVAENAFFESFNGVFPGTDFVIRSKPKEFQKIYVDVHLKPEDLNQIYNPKDPVTRHGVFPDYAIDNKKSKKT